MLAVRPLYPLLLIIMMDRSERVSEGDEKTFLISISDGVGYIGSVMLLERGAKSCR
jgi:hypothetical protein